MPSVKREVIHTIFTKLKSESPGKSVYEFNNKKVKEISGPKFMNQFDATKFDSSKLLPKSLKDEGFFIVHLGKGKHAFVKGEGYHNFEKVTDIKDWKITKSVIDNISDSEAQSASTAYNEGITQDFLFEDRNIKLKVHTARRSRTSYMFKIGKEELFTDGLQIELDGIFETENTLASIEVKNVEHEDFEIRQLFNHLKYFEKLKQEGKIPKEYNIRVIFVVRIKKGINHFFRLYEYKFTNNKSPNSIELVKSRQYNIIT